MRVHAILCTPPAASSCCAASCAAAAASAPLAAPTCCRPNLAPQPGAPTCRPNLPPQWRGPGPPPRPLVFDATRVWRTGGALLAAGAGGLQPIQPKPPTAAASIYIAAVVEYMARALWQPALPCPPALPKHKKMSAALWAESRGR